MPTFHASRVGILLVSLIVIGVSGGNGDAQDAAKKANAKAAKDQGPEADNPLPKYEDLQVPSAEDLFKITPFDWVVLKNSEVLIVEPVGPRPDTLNAINNEFQRYSKGRAGLLSGEEKLRERRLRFLKLPLTLINAGKNQDPDYLIETKLIQRIEYFEDMVLKRANELIDERRIPLAYDLLLMVDRRNRENNIRLKESYEALKREEAEVKAAEEKLRYNVPESPPLQLNRTWPRFDETYYKLLLADAEVRSNRGDNESALRVLENLWDHNSSLGELSQRFGVVIDELISESIERSDFRRARHFLGRLTVRDAQHPVAIKWKNELIAQTTNLIAEARTVSAESDAAIGANLIERAARIWPETPGLKDAHRELIDKFQSVRLGVLELPGNSTKSALASPIQRNSKTLTDQVLFEPIRIDEGGVRYRSSLFDSWEPTDLGRRIQFTLRLKRAEWEARPLITSADIFGELVRKIDPNQTTHDERLAGVIDRITLQSPSQFTIEFRRLPLRLEALMQFSVSIGEESLSLNPEIPEMARSLAGRQRFYESERDDHHVSYRRVRPQLPTIKTRKIDEIVFVRYESWDHALQGLLRGETVGVLQVGLRDLKSLQSDNRFFVLPYFLPVSHFILFNPECVALRDGQLRRALSLALPRDEIVKQSILADVAEPLARVTATPFPTTSYGHNRVLAEPAFDPQRAAALALTAKKQLRGQLPVLRMSVPKDTVAQATVPEMIERWKRVGITVQVNNDSPESQDNAWDLAYCTTRIIEPLTELGPVLSMRSDASIQSLKPLPERVRRQLLELEQLNDWPTAIKLLHRIESELLIEVRYLPLWEVDDFFITRRHLLGLPATLMHPFHDVERWRLQSWYPQEVP